jgi:hypothetical protein
MKSSSVAVLFVAAAALVLAITGCSKNSTSPVQSVDATPLSTTPGDGSNGVPLDAQISLSFATSVEKAVVERNFHLFSERDMADSLCPVSKTMGHGNMTMTMMDSGKMHHLDQVHSTHGRFSWNGDSTRCTFAAESIMTPRTQYMMHLGHEMVEMIERRVGSMKMMSGHGCGMMSDEMMFHFSTIGTTSTGGGHNGHH